MPSGNPRGEASWSLSAESEIPFNTSSLISTFNFVEVRMTLSPQGESIV
ncbi:MAG: hypothetical protein J6C03_06615 [Clostridia bacterium]|nr:hypothetical protein [Clostridia bacterium]